MSSSECSSDLEQAAPLVAERQTLARAPLCRGLLAGLTVATICVVGVTRLPSPAVSRDAVATPKLGRLSGVVQAYAVERGGRALTSADIEHLYSHMAETKQPRTRALLERFSTADSTGDPGQVAGELSERCQHAIQGSLQEAFEYFAKLLVEVFFGCLGDEESEECAKANAKVDSFFDDVTAKCQADGESCNITAVGMEGGKRVHESQAVCVPVACRDEAKQAMDYLKDQMGEKIEEAQAEGPLELTSAGQEKADDCENCTVSIECALDGPSGRMLFVRGD